MSKMILIIEDEESIQNIIKAFLEDAGYTVILAADGMEGIEQFRANKPDLVLLDLMLPKIDGFAVCEILRKESHVPIIMLTALDDDDSQMKGFDALHLAVVIIQCGEHDDGNPALLPQNFAHGKAVNFREH